MEVVEAFQITDDELKLTVTNEPYSRTKYHRGQKGDYLVIDERGKLSIMSKEDFEREFEPKIDVYQPFINEWRPASVTYGGGQLSLIDPISIRISDWVVTEG